jgi:hypothetical protein
MACELGVARGTVKKALSSLELKSALPTAPLTPRPQTDAAGGGPLPKNGFGLVAGIDFSTWSLDILPCRLYAQIEDLATRAGVPMRHYQPEALLDRQAFFQRLADDGVKRLALDAQLSDRDGVDRLLLEELDDRLERVVLYSPDAPRPDAWFDQVCVDWRVGARAATALLLSRGCRHLLFAGYAGVPWCEDRRLAFLAELRKAGLWDGGEPLPCVTCADAAAFDKLGRPRQDLAAAGAPVLLEAIDRLRPDGVLCAQDWLAEELSLLRPLAALPPLIGFDNNTWARANGLTTIGPDIQRLAEVLCRLLQQERSDCQRIHWIPTLLVDMAISS